jgi:Flp pilus assembly pilin Flp
MISWLRLLRDERGVSAIEYCVLVALVAVGLVIAVQLLGSNVSASYTQAGDALSEASGGGDGSDSDGDDDDDNEDGDGDSGEGEED